MAGKTTSRRNFLRPKNLTSALGASVALAAPEKNEPDDRLIRAGRRAMACQFEIFLPAGKRSKIRVVHEALNEVGRLEAQMSIFRENSEVSRLNRTAHERPEEVEKGLFELLRLAVTLSGQTAGAYDVTASPLWRCWGFSTREVRVPSSEEIRQTRERVGFHLLELDSSRSSVFFQRPGVEINLGSIGKGYALDREGEILKSAGLTDALLHAGHSSILALGHSPAGGEGWKVSIRHPLEKKRDAAAVRLQGRGMGTSGAGEQYFIWEGEKYGHVIDPRTGFPADAHLSATAIAPAAAEADALSTAFFIMSLDEIEQYCQDHPGVGAVVIPKPSGASLRCCGFGVAREDLEVYL